MDFLLIAILLVPFIGAIVGAFVPGTAARTWALFVSLVTAILAAVLAYHFFNAADGAGAGSGAFYRISLSRGVVDKVTISAIGFPANMGVDAISTWLIILTAFLTPLAIAASFGSIKEREKEYYAWMTMLLGAMLG